MRVDWLANQSGPETECSEEHSNKVGYAERGPPTWGREWRIGRPRRKPGRFASWKGRFRRRFVTGDNISAVAKTNYHKKSLVSNRAAQRSGKGGSHLKCSLRNAAGRKETPAPGPPPSGATDRNGRIRRTPHACHGGAPGTTVREKLLDWDGWIRSSLGCTCSPPKKALKKGCQTPFAQGGSPLVHDE